MSNRAPIVASMLILLGVAGCNQESQQQAIAPASPATQVPAAVVVDAPILGSDLDLAFRMVGNLTYSASADTASFRVEVANNGKATVASAGKLPVQLGLVVQGPDGTMQMPPANQDFVRVPLPQALEPGQRVEISVTFPAAPTLGGKVVLDGVQEQVAWFSGYGKPVLELGSFKRCDGAEATLCLVDGTAVVTVN